MLTTPTLEPNSWIRRSGRTSRQRWLVAGRIFAQSGTLRSTPFSAFAPGDAPVSFLTPCLRAGKSSGGLLSVGGCRILPPNRHCFITVPPRLTVIASSPFHPASHRRALEGLFVNGKGQINAENTSPSLAANSSPPPTTSPIPGSRFRPVAPNLRSGGRDESSLRPKLSVTDTNYRKAFPSDKQLRGLIVLGAPLGVRSCYSVPS